MNHYSNKQRMIYLTIIVCVAVLPNSVSSSYNIAQGKPASQSTVYSGWGADKAVDGVIGKDVEANGGGSCSSTNPTGSREAWWSVDLQHISRIKSMNVTYRQLYPFRLSGFYLYVSNASVLSGQRDTWHLCYHDGIKDPDLLPSFNQSRPCMVDGRYVIFFNKRPADNEPKNHRYYSSTNAVVELCEVQVFGCPINRFGPDCNKRCHCGVGGCDPDTGLCDVTGCQSGWTGQTCSEECGPGLFGDDCRYTCHCLTPGCNKTSGTCTVPGCEAGWKGNACDSACGPGTFGWNCLQTCHCAKPGCNHVNGICNEQGCAAGWTGLACDNACPAEHFGMDCKHTCHCAFPGCDRFQGICTHPGCIAGWNGTSCDRPCGVGKYGKDCRYNCNCATPGCDAMNGNCIVPGCEVGWQSSTCNKACNISTFGSNCDQTCHCTIPGCDRFTGLCNVTGCDVGWTGPTCAQVDDNGVDSQLAGIIGGVCAAVAIIIITIIVTLILIKRRRQTLSKGNDFMSKRKRPETLIIDKKKDESIYVNTASLGVELACDSENQHKVQHKQQDDTQEVDGEDDEVIYVNNPTRSPVIEDTKLKVTDLHKIIAKKQNDDAFDTEYQNLPHGLVHPHDTSKAPENVIMNRFKTTFAYDHSRVILRKEKESCSDYINANYIEDTKGVKAYIATQGPKETTLEDFWRMAWQNESGKIVMLANLVELGKKKCCNYWARNDGEALQLGLYQVTLQEEVTYAFHTIRNLSVKNKQTNARRQITQYHFTKWPDHGVPEAFELLQFHRWVQSGQTDLTGPIIVHCSAGIGRTGTYIGLDALLKEGENNDKIDVFAYTNRMRKDRMNMIQTLNQYKVLHEVLAEGLTVVSESMTGSIFSKKVLSLFAEGKVEAQFKVLEKNKPNYKGKETALSRSNKQKNKDIAIPAVEKYRIYLTSAESNYINAVNIPSYRDPHGYILTQHPLSNTVGDFWSMVSQQSAEVVVSIGTPQDGKPWPTDTTHLETFGDFTVQYDKSQSKALDSDLLVERKLSLHDKRTTTETVVTVHETSSWKGKGSLPSMKSMLELIQHVLTLKSSVSSTIVLACPDGATDSGLLCVLCNVMERLKVDGDIDIMAAVRQIQIRRPQCLSDKEQYQFCYNVMKEHMETASIYAND